MASTRELLLLAQRMGLEGAELKAWYDEQEARAREERAAEREARKQQIEHEQRVLQLRIKVAEAERAQALREIRKLESHASSIERASDTRSRHDVLKSLSSGCLERRRGLSLELDAQRESENESLAGSRKGSIGPKMDRSENIEDLEKEQAAINEIEARMRTRASNSTSHKEAKVPPKSPTHWATGRIDSDLEEDEVSNETLAHSSCVSPSAVTSGLTKFGDHSDSLPRERVSIAAPRAETRERESSVSEEMCFRASGRQSTFDKEQSAPLLSSNEIAQCRSTGEHNVVISQSDLLDVNVTYVHSCLCNEETDQSPLSAEAESISGEVPGTGSADRSELHSNAPNPVSKIFRSQCMQLKGCGSRVNDVLDETKVVPGRVSQMQKRRTVRLTWDAIT